MDPITLEVFNHRFSAIAEEMGVALCRSAFSPNIKERRDFSCALFDARGDLVAQAAHIPVHLGSTPASVQAAIAARPMEEGDVVVLNDPYSGGTHLPDVTVVAPVFHRRQLVGYVANRAHHADIGGMTPGSMPLATEIYQEGLRLPPVWLVRRGRLVDDVRDVFVANARVPAEREGDLQAQLAALRVGDQRLRDLIARAGVAHARQAMHALQAYAERLMRHVVRQLRPGDYRAVDYLEDDGAGHVDLPIAVRVRLRNGNADVDFTGSAAQATGGINANFSVTLAATVYVFRALAEVEIPANAGMMRPVRLHAPLGTVVNAKFPAAVAGGNVETSQRIVDVLLRALAPAARTRIPAASCGTMNNVAFGGYDRRRARSFSYYETMCGGAGGGPHGPGLSAVHTHMTNTLNTPIEALEAELPVRIVQYRVRRGSGGVGAAAGGDGIIREIEFLDEADVTLLTERRRLRPYGLYGGGDGRPGHNAITTGATPVVLPAKVTLRVGEGGRLRVATPGGGAWGARKRRH